MQKKRILLISPDAHMHKFIIGPLVKSSREAPLTLTTLAGMVPEDKFDVQIVDGSIDKIPLDFPADLVGISAITGTSKEAYELATHFRNRGIPVVLGGVHVTIMPDEARQHADSILIGMGEESWPELLQDFLDGCLKPVYEAAEPEGDMLLNVPTPRVDLLRRNGYMLPDTVQATRGCKHSCDFCAVPTVWSKYYKRPVADVIRDIKNLPGRYIAFNDVSIIEDVEYAKELFAAMIPLKVKWGGLSTMLITKDPELMELAARSGCVYLLLGFESASQLTLKKIYKGFNKGEDYYEIMRCMHDYGITVQGCFVFGFDQDDKSAFQQTVDYVNELKVDIPRYSIYTPYPKTKLFDRLESEGRILTYNWDNYDTMHVVYQPVLLTPQELFDGFKWAYKQTFSMSSIGQRVMQQRLGVRSVVNLLGNATYRVFVHRLYNDERFTLPMKP